MIAALLEPLGLLSIRWHVMRICFDPISFLAQPSQHIYEFVVAVHSNYPLRSDDFAFRLRLRTTTKITTNRATRAIGQRTSAKIMGRRPPAVFVTSRARTMDK